MKDKQKNLVWGLIIVLILVIFACLNTEPVAINFGIARPKLPLIIVLVIMILLGALISLLLGLSEKRNPAVKKALKEQEASIKKNYDSMLADKNQKISELEAELDKSKKKVLDSDKDID